MSIDWDGHWETNEEPADAHMFAVKMADRLRGFMKNKPINCVADFGCGPGTTLFTLAKSMPNINFYGYDAAATIIEINEEKTRNLQLKNLYFEQDSLPYPKTRQKFDLVTCFSTLHYVKDIEQALIALFKLVIIGGYLIFNYPNIYTKKVYQKDINPEDEYMKQRFALVLSGKNLLSLRKIEKILGFKPKKFYSSIKSNIYVSIYKPIR